MMAALVLPDVPADRDVNLKEHYWRERVPFFASGLAAISWSIVKEIILEGRPPERENMIFHLVFLTMSGVALASRREALHKLFAGAMFLIFLAYIAALFTRLG